MKKFIIATAFLCACSLNAFADKAYDELTQAVTKNEATSTQMDMLIKQYKGTLISGSGYVLDVKTSETNGDVTIWIVVDKDIYAIMPNVSIDVPSANPKIEVAKKLKKGDKVSFIGRLVDVYAGKMLMFKEDVKLEM